VTAALEDQGIRVLRNAAAEVDTGWGTLWIAGVDDAISAREDPKRTFPTYRAAPRRWPYGTSQIMPIARLNSTLSPGSRGAAVAAKCGCRASARSCFHEGGQCYAMGLNNANGMPIFTTRGVGVYFPPLRY
jgi:hypothetical protein